MSEPAAFQSTFEADSKQRRRVVSAERSKAHHLCGQLKLRLQYAKLKVEHGWQRQNLNEVENLYFHHTHANTPYQRRPLDTSPAAQKRSAANRARAAAALARSETRQREREQQQGQGQMAGNVSMPGHAPQGDNTQPLFSTPSHPQYSKGIPFTPPSSRSVTNSLQATSTAFALQQFQPDADAYAYSSPVSSSFHPNHTSHAISSTPLSNMSASSPSADTAAAVAALLASATTMAGNRGGGEIGAGALTYDAFWSSHASKFPAIAASTAAFNLNNSLGNHFAVGGGMGNVGVGMGDADANIDPSLRGVGGSGSAGGFVSSH